MKWQKFTILTLLSLFLVVSRAALAQNEATSTGDSVNSNTGEDKGNPSGGASFGPGGSGNNQTVARDVVGLRVVPNPQHLSPLNWYYQNIKIKGSPQSMIVDGYEAVRDGRTVYVSAARILDVRRCSSDPTRVCTNNNQCGEDPGSSSLPSKLINIAWAASCDSSNVPELFTNIYIISYNQSPETTTTDIFGQLLQYWKFNVDLKNCSKTVTQVCSGEGNGGCPQEFCGHNHFCNISTEKACSSDNDCPHETCGPTGWCSQTSDRACFIDGDCPDGEYCNSKKATIIRDTKRLYVLAEVKTQLENYNKIIKHYPKLDSGTYLTNRTISTWPSWSDTFSSTTGSAMPVDAVNKLGLCKTDPIENARFDPKTCWDEKVKEFAGTSNPLTPPANSRVYYYQYIGVTNGLPDNKFKFCAIFESGYVQGKAPLSAICQTGNTCNVDCSNKQCGNNGCGGTCGTCTTGKVCQSGRCVKSGTPYYE